MVPRWNELLMRFPDRLGFLYYKGFDHLIVAREMLVCGRAGNS